MKPGDEEVETTGGGAVWLVAILLGVFAACLGGVAWTLQGFLQ